MRGAPAIAIVAVLCIALELKKQSFPDNEEGFAVLKYFLRSRFHYLVSARPTAVNISRAAETFQKRISEFSADEGISNIQACLVREMEQMLPDDITANQAIGKNGAEHILRKLPAEKNVSILTHCNTGSLATAGYGTALGVIRTLKEMDRLEHVYCTETRPYNQGSRLTAYELVYEGIPSSLVCDSMGAILMKERTISAVVVGADRIVANGDTANKVGTYQLAIVAKYHGIPFYIAAPTTSIDFTLKMGSEIVIEERPSKEMFVVNGKNTAAEGIGCWNPAFDVTPAELITGGVVTEHGVYPANDLHVV